MLLFLPEGSLTRLYPSLEEAQVYSERVLVVEAEGVPGLHTGEGQYFTASHIPDAACLNATPYMPACRIEAAGGYVVRSGGVGPEVLMIFRRGFWDLPKGKRDEGETIEACALREVREEVGVRSLETRRSLGTTLHGYPERGRYWVKTTFWFLMNTSETTFTPQEQERIEKVEWVPWGEACRRVGFAGLRAHMEAVGVLVNTAL